MNRPPVRIGSIVLSRAGRDEGRQFVVIAEVDTEYVLISDGRTHKVEKPKKKKLKHLKLVREPAPDISERLLQGGVENHEVRKWLSDKEEERFVQI